MKKNSKIGHRERLRERFIKGQESAYTEEVLLELLLTYSIPQKDLQEVSKNLIEKFGNFSEVLSADIASLCELSGIKDYSAVLIKLVDCIRNRYPVKESKMKTVKENKKISLKKKDLAQPGLFDVSVSDSENTDVKKEEKETKASSPEQHRGPVLFTKALLKEAVSFLPKFPDTESTGEIKEFLRNNLHFSSETTRNRYANYIVRRLYPSGYADEPLRLFALKYQDRQELRDVCFYRLCKAEPLLYDIIKDLLIPSIGRGRIERESLRNYLKMYFPSSQSIGDGSQAVVEALTGANIANCDRKSCRFSYRQILLPSFAFILHSEFPEPGIYDIGKIENNRAVNSMLWNPDGILTSLYELRNQEFISKISEIDNVRQFTTRWSLEELINHM